MDTIATVENDRASTAHAAPHHERSSQGLQADFSSWAAATSDPSELSLGEPGFTYADLFDPARLAVLADRVGGFFLNADPEGFARFAAYRAGRGQGMKAEAVSEVL